MKAKSLPIFFLLFGLLPLKARTIHFAGRTWFVRSGYGGPGPNYWSDSPQSVWVDSSGALHLKIRYENGTWYCSEVFTEAYADYGMHRFYANTRIDSLDPNAVFAFFLYANDTTEIDIEFSRWGDPNSWFNAQYVVQPWYMPGNIERFPMQLNGPYSTHSIHWLPDSVVFKSIHGHYPEPPSPGYLIRQWTYRGMDNPSAAESLRLHINLWLYQGNPPSDGAEVEVIVQTLDTPSEVVERFNHSLEETEPQIRYVLGPPPRVILQLPAEEPLIIRLIDPMGRIREILRDQERKNRGIYILPLRQKPAGIYFLQVRTPVRLYTQKLLFFSN